MKNLKKIIGIFSVLSFTCLNISLATTGIVNTPAVRIREKASTDSEIITKAYEDEEVEIIGEEGDWYKVKVNGKTGYASKSLIKTSDASTNTSSNSNTSTNTTTNSANSNTTNNNTSNNTVANTASSNNANNVSTYNVEEPQNTESKNIVNKDTVLRLLPNFASSELRVLTKDTEVKVEKELNNWVKISLTDSGFGWVLKNSITYAKVEDTDKTPVKEQSKGTENKVEENTTEENNTEKNTTLQNTSAENTVTDNNRNNTVDSNKTSAKNSTGTVNVETANVREKPTTDSSIIAHLDEGDEVTIVQEDGDWYKITSKEVDSGYVSKSLITLSKGDVSSRSLSEAREENVVAETVNNSTKGEEVVEFAKQLLGASYVLGGKTPESGFDCSGFTRYVFKNFGYSLGTVASDQDSVGTVVERNDLQPGDLILFQNEEKTKIGHTGIYIGNNEFIHSANPERGVVIDNLNTMQYYNERFVTARRIV